MKKGICNRDFGCYSQEKCNMKSVNQVYICYMGEEEDSMHNQTFLKLCIKCIGEEKSIWRLVTKNRRG